MTKPNNSGEIELKKSKKYPCGKNLLTGEILYSKEKGTSCMVVEDKLDMNKGIWGMTPNGKWHKALEYKANGFYSNFRYDKYNERLQRKIIRKGVETWINATDKQVWSWIEQYNQQSIQELKEKIEEMKQCYESCKPKCEGCYWNDGYNEALEDIINLLNK